MKIYISINGVLRDFLNKAVVEYRKLYVETPPEDKKDDFEYKINNVQSNRLQDILTFKDEDEMRYFLYVESVMEIFGHAAPMYRNVMHDLFKYESENKKYDIVLVSQEYGRSIPATFFFLAKSTCFNKRFRFYESEADIPQLWKECFIWITDDPEIIKQKPKHKKVIKINKEYNKSNKANLAVDSLSDLLLKTVEHEG